MHRTHLFFRFQKKMRVDMDYMLMLTDKSESELVAELGDKIYQNPQKNMRWESADEYLTGNIRAKLAAAEEAGLERNIEVLRAVMPQRVEAADISVKLGSAWIDPEYIRQFILETLKPDFQTRNSIEVIYSEATDKWKVDGYQHSYRNTLATETYGTSDMNAYEIIEVSLNMKKAEIRERVKDENGIEVKDEKGRYVLAVNQDKTMVVQSKQDELKKKFKDWIFATPERREKLTNLYNEKFNSVRLREYDGSHLNFVGMNSNIALKPHQKNAVARSLYSNGNTLIAHEVGAGKTFEMVAIAMEGKRLGLHSKPLITAPNALTEQWGDAFRTLYPNSNVLVATEKDFKPENRRDLFAKIATGDWDAVIIGHSQFDMIHLSRERELETLYSEVDKLEAALDEISATSNKGSYSVKQVERAIKSYTDKIQKLLEKTPKEDMLCFEQLGIDKIFVDESQAYKNLATATKMHNVSGLGSGGSARSFNLLMKSKYMDELTSGKGMTFASGTPVETGYLRSQMPILRCFYYLFLKLPWAAPVNLFKSLGKIAVVVKAAKAADGVYGVGGVLYHIRRIAQAVIFQILKRGLTRYVPEAPENLAFADECGCCHVVKCDLFGVMVVDKKQYVTEPCLLGNAGSRVRRHILFRQMDKYSEKLGKLVADNKLVIWHPDIFHVPDVCEQPQDL